MKTYTIIIVCLTLGLFYGLAVKMEHKNNLDKNSKKNQSSALLNSIDSKNLLSRSCSNNVVTFTTDKLQSVHFDNNDEFSMQVTGKEREYLNTGVTFIENNESDFESDHSDFHGSGS